MADNAIGEAGRSIDLSALPRVTFTSPQIASVGTRGDEAEAAGHRVGSRVLAVVLKEKMTRLQYAASCSA